jgi:biotin-(acetyl-CoA carboxylase) ligase
VLGIGVNVALQDEDFPPELRGRAGTLGRAPGEVELVLAELLVALTRWLAAPADRVLDVVRARDALLGQPVSWTDGAGRGAGIDADGRLLVSTDAGELALDAGEVHLADHA